MNVLLLDNYDAFTNNLFQYLSELGAAVQVYGNDEIEVEEVKVLQPDRIIISPGPDTPAEAGIALPLIRELGIEIPILGVGLGHEAIGVAYGGRVIAAAEITPGELSTIFHAGAGVFHDLPSPFEATRDYSSIVERESLPDSLEITAWTGDGLIMGLRHRSLPVEGMQFHPWSHPTDHGKRLLRNFLEGVSWS
jgi:anthranilate synthase component 2